MKIPKYIIKDIEQISKYADRIVPLMEEVEEWYNKILTAHEDVLDDISDDEFSDIATYASDLKEFNLTAIMDNLNLIEEQS